MGNRDTEIAGTRQIDGCSPCQPTNSQCSRFSWTCAPLWIWRAGYIRHRKGRVAMPLVKQDVMPVAREFGNHLLSAFVPEMPNVIVGNKRPSAVMGEKLKKGASKTIASTTSAAVSSKRFNARAYKSSTPITCVSETMRPIAEIVGQSRWAAGRRTTEPAGVRRGAGCRLGGKPEFKK